MPIVTVSKASPNGEPVCILSIEREGFKEPRVFSFPIPADLTPDAAQDWVDARTLEALDALTQEDAAAAAFDAISEGPLDAKRVDTAITARAKQISAAVNIAG